MDKSVRSLHTLERAQHLWHTRLCSLHVRVFSHARHVHAHKDQLLYVPQVYLVHGSLLWPSIEYNARHVPWSIGVHCSLSVLHLLLVHAS